jgi:undecaprenyl-diphosphatase
MEFLESFDQGFWNFLQTKRQPGLDPFVMAGSLLGKPWFLAAVVLLTAILFCFRRWFAETALVLASFGGGLLLAIALGWLIDRPAPDVVSHRQLEEALTHSSFPSRETMAATATYLAIAVALRPRLRRKHRAPALWAGLFLSGLVAISRAFVGSNYPSDVLAGGLGGLAWELVCYAAVERWLPEWQVSPKPKSIRD